MSATIMSPEQILITEDIIREAQQTPVPRGSEISIQTNDGQIITLSKDLQHMLLQALKSVASSGEVTIGRIPEDLTSTTAADILGVSRPTLMKWVREGEIDAFKVRSHTRFKRDEVFRLKNKRAEERRKAFQDLRSSTAENQEFFDD